MYLTRLDTYEGGVEAAVAGCWRGTGRCRGKGGPGAQRPLVSSEFMTRGMDVVSRLRGDVPVALINVSVRRTLGGRAGDTTRR